MGDPRRLHRAPPTSWLVLRARRLFSERSLKDHPDEEVLSASQQFGVVPQAFLEVQRDARVMAAFKGLENFKLVEPNDFVISLRSFQGGIERSKHRGIVSPAYTVMRPGSRVHPPFFRHYLKDAAFIDRLNAVTTGIRDGRTIRYGEFAEMELPLPPLPVQRAIADFLDRKTAAIDGLIAKKERLIELLQEKRQALITRAVTKGLDPNVPMKDSGIEWLGEIPAHWEVKAIKWISSVKRGASPRPIDDPRYFDDEGEYAWVRIADVTAAGERLMVTTQRLSAVGASLSVKLQPGELFLSIAGTVGKPCITEIRCCIHDGFVYFPRLKNLLPSFLFYVFASEQPYRGLGKLGTQLNLNTDTVGSIRIAIPPSTEQEEIVSALTDVLEKVDQAASLELRSIDRLREYRQALITAAVTGQLEVAENIAEEAVA